MLTGNLKRNAREYDNNENLKQKKKFHHNNVPKQWPSAHIVRFEMCDEWVALDSIGKNEKKKQTRTTITN